MQQLLVFQSLWALEQSGTRNPAVPLEVAVERIAAAGFDGISAHWYDRDHVRRLSDLSRPHGFQFEGQCFPKTIDDLKPVLEIAAEFGVHHICVQADVRPRRLEDCLPLLEGWQRLSEEAGIPVLVETHRYRMTSDLLFTLDLLDRMPRLRLLGDVSHYIVGREIPWPVPEEDDAMIRRILDSSSAFHGRVASSEQIQLEISFAHHRRWLDLFLAWWEYGFHSWRGRAAADATLAFTCELGPQPYAIADRSGEDSTDRWEEALILMREARRLWEKTAPAAG